MSPASRKRKPKKKNIGPARPPRVSSLAETIKQALEITTLPQARTWASDLIGHYRAVAWNAGQDPEIGIGQLQFELAEIGGATGTAAAFALSLVGRRTRRAEFAAVGEKLALATGAMPAWYAGDLKLRLRAAHSIIGAGGDTEALVLEYDDHMLGVIVDHVGLMLPLLNVLVLAPGDGVAVVRDLARPIGSGGEPVVLSPAEVSYRLFGPVTTFGTEGPNLSPEDIVPADHVRKIIGRTALLEAVLSDLPPAPADESVIERFMADHATDEKWSRWWATFVVGRAEDTGRAATDFGRVFGQTQIIKLAREVAVPNEAVPALTEAIRAWARFTNADWTDDLPDLLAGYAALNARENAS